MNDISSAEAHPPDESRRGAPGWWHRTPLYIRILAALVLGCIVGVMWGPQAQALKPISDLILRLLRALATPLILVAVVHALLTAHVTGRTARRLAILLATNTLVAIVIGLLVANVIQPGRWAHIAHPSTPATEKRFDPWELVTGNVPQSVVGPLVDNNVLAVIMLAIAFGIALRTVRARQIQEGRDAWKSAVNLIETAFDCLIVVLHWIIDLVPFAVFAVVAALVGSKGFTPFLALGAFVLTVILGLILQAAYYLTRIRLQSWVRPAGLIRGAADALATAFSTASSTATMPITYACLRDRVGLREESASMGALVGSNFNNDGTALYEAMSALFIAQVIGLSLGLPQQVVVVFMSVVASVGAAGIPEAGLVTMLAVFHAVGLPVEYVPLLLTVDWFLDRCRTTINVMGDMTVSCLLDGRKAQDGVVEG